MAIIFSILTCGIYLYYWFYQIMSSHYHLTGRRDTAGMDLVLGLVTCGIYFIYMGYKMGKLEAEIYDNYADRSKDDSILYIILNIFGMFIITYAIVQSNLNYIVDHGRFDGPPPVEGPPPAPRNWDDRSN